LWSALFGNVSMVYRVGNLGGADGFQRRDMKTLLAVLPGLSLDGAARLLGRLGVAYMIGPSARQSSRLEVVQAGHGAIPFVYRVQDATPFAHLANQLYLEKSEANALVRLAREDFDSDRDAVVEELPPGWRDSTPHEVTGGELAEVVRREDELIELKVITISERLLVVNVADYPGWETTVDGRPAFNVRTNGLVQGVLVPPGEHRVKLRFESSGFRWGLLTSAVAMAGLGVVGLPRRLA
jgi:hypothetical protein